MFTSKECCYFQFNAIHIGVCDERVKIVLTRVQGITGVPLVYVVGHQLIPEPEDEDPAFGEVDGKYTSHDQEMIARSPILTNNSDYDLSYEDLEADGPFVLPFLTDPKKVWAILHALLSASSMWQPVKKFGSTQNSHHDWCTWQQG